MNFNETISGAENSQSQIRLFVSWSWSRDHFLDQSEGLEWLLNRSIQWFNNPTWTWLFRPKHFLNLTEK